MEIGLNGSGKTFLKINTYCNFIKPPTLIPGDAIWHDDHGILHTSVAVGRESDTKVISHGVFLHLHFFIHQLQGVLHGKQLI